MVKNFLIVLMSLVLFSCSSEHDLVEGLNNGQLQTDMEEMSTLLEKPSFVVFADIQKHILEPSCVSCHGGSEKIEANVDLRSFDALSGKTTFKNTLIPSNPERSLLYETLIVKSGSRHMPPLNKPQLSEAHINLMYQWIKNGAKVDVAQKVERPKSLKEIFQPYFDAPETIDYGLVRKHVFDNSCTKCHSNDEPTVDWEAVAHGQNMTTYQDLFKSDVMFSQDGIVKGKLTDTYTVEGGTLKKHEGSRIYRSVAISQSMPPAKDGYEPMDSLRVKVLRLWILNCAIEDYDVIKDDDNLIESAIEKKSSKVRDCTVPEPPSEGDPEEGPL